MRGLQFAPWPLLATERPVRQLRAIGAPLHADGTPNYGYLDHGRWWESPQSGRILDRGWVRDSRFGPGDVIPGARRKAKA